MSDDERAKEQTEQPKEEAPAPVTVDEDETDDEDWRTIELPEGVTLR